MVYSACMQLRSWILMKQEMAIMKTANMVFPAASVVAILLLFFPPVMGAAAALDLTIPNDKTQLSSWFSNTIRSYKNPNRASTIDANLTKSEQDVKIIKVSKAGDADFKTVMDAVNSIPTGNTQRVIVWIKGGTYEEKITVDRTRPFVTFYGSPNNMPMLSFGGTAAKYGTVDSATLIVEADYFMLVNIIVINSAPNPTGFKPGEQALAMRVSGDKGAFYNSKLIGFQDTLSDYRGRHFFKGCYVEGTVDFIFGRGRSVYIGCELHAIGQGRSSVITAQGRDTPADESGYSFVHCTVSGTGQATYLGRAWMSMPRTVFAYTYMSAVVNPEGWSDNAQPNRAKTVFFGEYQCVGPGADLSKRVAFTKKLTAEEAKPFLTLDYIGAASWLLPPPNLALD